MSALATMAVETTYGDVEKMIFKICHKFRRRYGGDFNELVARGNELFMRSYRKYNPEDGSFTTYLWLRVWGGLMDDLRGKLRKERRLTEVNHPLENVAQLEPSDWDVPTFLKGLSGDAKVVVMLTLTAPKDIPHAMMMKSVERCNGKPSAYRTHIKEYLLDMGWTFGRITESFKEVGQALTQ